MSNKIKAVLFDMGGVLIPQPQKAIAAYAKKLGIPRDFLPQLFLDGVPNNSFCKLERGEYTLTEFYQHFNKEAALKAEKEKLLLPKEFSTNVLFHSIGLQNKRADGKFPIKVEFLHAVNKLRENGILTCILTNNWVDDSPNSYGMSLAMMYFKLYFDEVVESSKEGFRKPENAIYELTCKKLGVLPSETVFLDDIGLNLKSASRLGINCIKVTEVDNAIRELENAVQLNLTVSKDKILFPPPAQPEKVSHAFVTTAPDVRIHYVEAGQGPVVILLHGFPDLWYGWRHQIFALVQAGYRVIALDQRGFGTSTCPPDINDYSQRNLCDDVLKLMDVLCIAEATVIGHDWGGSLAWVLALVFPHRFKAVCGVNTPFYPINPNRSPMVSMKKNPGVFDYQLYFQEPGVPEREFESNVQRSLSLIMQGVQEEQNGGLSSTSDVRKRGGMFVGAPANPSHSSFMTNCDIDYYVKNFKKSGFRGPLNWYRNYEENWQWLKRFAGRKITIPALMVTASHDTVLKPEYSFGMEKRVPLLTRLHIEDCSHWTMQEKPYELNCGLVKWLDGVHNKASLVPSKL